MNAILEARPSGPSQISLPSLAGINDAPSDGNFYARQNGAWVIANPGASDIIYIQDDFVEKDWQAGGGAAYRWYNGVSGAGTGGAAAWSTDHVGVYQLNITTATGSSWLQPQTDLGISSMPFSALKKAVCRAVIKADAAFQTAVNDGEWTFGWSDNFPSVQYGALFSIAPGFTGGPGANGVGGSGVTGAGGLLVGTYNNVSTNHYGYIQTFFTITPNTWYDFIISWTPAGPVKFYVAQYGSAPTLVGTITDNIATVGQTLFLTNLRGTAGGNNVNVFVDRIEYIYQLTKPAVLLGQGLLNF